MLAATLARVDPQLVGVGLRNIDPLANRRHSFLPQFAAVLEVVHRALPDAPVVVGGAGFSMFPVEIMRRYPRLDVGVVLEGEETFPELVSRVAAGSRRRRARPRVPPAAGRLAVAAGTPGTIVRTGAAAGALVAGPPRPRLAPAELDRVRPWLPELAAAYQHTSSYAPAAGVETKRGCPLGCSYCVYPALQGRQLRFRSPATIVAEVELLHREAGVEWVHFTDPVLNDPARPFSRGVPAVDRGGSPGALDRLLPRERPRSRRRRAGRASRLRRLPVLRRRHLRRHPGRVCARASPATIFCASAGTWRPPRRSPSITSW